MSALDSSSDAAFDKTDIDRELIALTQEGLPLTPAPYAELARQLGIDEDEVIARMQAMLNAGVIRRIAAVPNHYKLGFTANGMTVWDVPDELAKAIGEEVGNLNYVSHCYLRPRHPPRWPYNLFAMVHGQTRDDVAELAGDIARILDDRCRDHDILFSTRILKKTGLRIARQQPER
ncbi:MAG: AsnC family transcriptional regulator [Gammaproteobacteria bacterium]|nr:AsnC family transcriptional regulator [Gammaproteobacteria bacterium]